MTLNIKDLGLMVSDKKICSYFLYISLCKTFNPVGQSQFGRQGHNLNKHGKGLLDDASYQILRLYALWFQTRRFFHVFPILAYVNM